MEIKKVLEHTCFQKDHPLSPINCRCRKYVSTVHAAKLINEGSAQFVIKSYKSLSVEEVCPVCNDQDKLKQSCSFCKSTGKVTVNKTIPVYGEDIITTAEPKGKRIASTIKKKTPRSPTVESNHIYRAIGALGVGAQAAFDRIEQYEILTLKERVKLLVKNYNAVEFEEAWDKAFPIQPGVEPQVFGLTIREEPADDQKAGTGRRYDYGRSL